MIKILEVIFKHGLRRQWRRRRRFGLVVEVMYDGPAHPSVGMGEVVFPVLGLDASDPWPNRLALAVPVSGDQAGAIIPLPLVAIFITLRGRAVERAS